ncbi:hypothetical protein GIX45_19545 [Erwinia sp. CPCC 100877]|nr:hypothetical protein [Erwinia sp. CPCC 100877]
MPAASLLALDSHFGDPAPMLCRYPGFQEAGRIPDFVINSDGSLAGATIFCYRLMH